MSEVEPFEIVVHQADRVLEVRYPARPTRETYERYEREVRVAIEQLARSGPWDCIVDQTALKSLAPDFPPRIADLNNWAMGRQMRRTARLVSDSAVGELQTMRILRDAGVSDIGRVFRSRQAAWAFVTGASGAPTGT